MAVTTKLKTLINSGLSRVNLQLDTLTVRKREVRRLQHLVEAGYFDAPAFPVPDSIRDARPAPILDELSLHSRRFEDLRAAAANPVGYDFDNGFFTSPDAEVLYCVIRRHKPRRIVEVGSGNSTKISRLAVIDGEIESRLISIDPQPRTGIDALADEVYRDPVEIVRDRALFAQLRENDVLFIDSSHELLAGNDLVYLYLNVIPTLSPGVLVHIHDVFLPYDYRPEWLLEHRLAYTEQYLVQAMLQCAGRFTVIWPGYYLQRTLTGFSDHFPHMGGRDALSLWLRVA